MNVRLLWVYTIDSVELESPDLNESTASSEFWIRILGFRWSWESPIEMCGDNVGNVSDSTASAAGLD